MAIPVEMPKMSDTMEEGVLSAWLAEEGDAVSSGDVIAQVETDKATMDLEVYDDGVLLKKLVDEGAGIPIGGLIAVLGKEGEDISDILAKYGGGATGQKAEATETEAPASAAEGDHNEGELVPTNRTHAGDTLDAPSAAADGAEPAKQPQQGSAPQASASTTEGGRIKASPLARAMAKERGIDLGGVSGTGTDGRIVRRDIEGYQAPAQKQAAPAAKQPAKSAPAKPQAPALASDGEFTTTPISQMRKSIGRRLAQSKFTAPHFYLTVDIDMGAAMAFRSQINKVAQEQERGKVSFNDLVTKACAVALNQHPAVNASWDDEGSVIRYHKNAHVAVAVAIEDGLLTPVIRDADRKGLAQIGAETRELAGRAKDKKLAPEEFSGSTFTTSNLGMFGIEEFTAIINPPNAAILAIGGIRDEAVVKDGAVVPGKRMKVTLSCDHRVLDGASGAAFLGTVKGLLEAPMTMLL